MSPRPAVVTDSNVTSSSVSPVTKNKRPNDFFARQEEEPHAERKKKILQDHPEIKELFGPEPMTKYLVVATVALQVYMAYLVRDWSWPYFLAAVYIVGATANHSLFLAIHEMSHNLGGKALWVSQAIAMVANMPICIAYSVTFKPYHMQHHRCQGDDGIDTDIPTELEAWLVTKTATCWLDHTLRKAIFMFFQIFGYALRPMMMKPELVPKDLTIVINWIVVLAFDAIIYYNLGVNAILYMLLSTFFAGSIHPTAGHFIAEHYVFEGKVETYSYYGPLNIFAYNVGYHNEHHDFPNIAWTRLPRVREVAPEYYDHLPQCKSWFGTILYYIFDDRISPYSRVKKRVSTKED